MLKKTIKYTDYNGNERTEDFYFNLTRTELVEMNFSAEGGLEAYITKIIQTQNGKEILAALKAIITKAYGEKSLDGKYFVKSPELSKAFSETEAFDILFMELATNAKAAADFVNSVISKSLNSTVENINSTADTDLTLV